MRTSCRFAMAVHVLTVLAYKEGDRVTSAFLAGSVNTNPVVIRRLLLALQRARLVETRKGAGFGSRLSRSPGRIKLSPTRGQRRTATVKAVPAESTVMTIPELPPELPAEVAEPKPADSQTYSATDHSAFHLYLQEIGQTKLLTRAEEAALAGRIK